MFGLGWPEVFIVLAVAVVLFGNKLPGVARALGKGLVEFKKGVGDVQDEISGVMK